MSGREMLVNSLGWLSFSVGTDHFEGEQLSVASL